ncbi:hypothetical protein DBR47_12330 [Paucibacter sp. KBW04]|uniref:site-specific integrase n=1 Tax=Paucibacter sp. KBW04 TaxID=2153361 RepID=UPI000F56F791|nr:site-specific integrase [Paucibacter sp. KBW04]RQO58493.1 hypothetical protein DBR47_12330 [Paucibacter sp. KBW04]
MAKPQKRVNKQGVVSYQVSIRIKDLPPIFKTYSTYEAAIEYQTSTEKRLRKEQREAADPRAWLPKSGDLADQRLVEVLGNFQKALPENAWHHSTIPALLEVCGDPTIGQLYPSWIKKYILRARKTTTIRKKPYAWGSIRHQLSVISSAIKWRAEQLDMNPPPFVVTEKAFVEAAKAEGLRKEALNNERNRRLEPGEEEALMRVLRNIDPRKKGKDHWPLFVQFAMHTGARLQEMVWAEWKEIDPSGEWWHIPGEHSKTKARTMMLTDEAMDVLEQLKALRSPNSKRIFHTLGEPDNVSDGFAKHARDAGLVDFVLHDLRHEGISRLVLTQIDLPIKALMEMVGHSSIEMLNRYAKLRPHEMNRLIRRRSPQQPPSLPSFVPGGLPDYGRTNIYYAPLRSIPQGSAQSTRL